jgi:hypothetical protein
MRNGDKIWWCKRIEQINEETPQYEKPQEFILRSPTAFSPIGITVQPKSGYTEVLDYGETTKGEQRVVLTPYEYWYNKFNRGDLFYVDGKKPSDEEQSYGQDANYYLEFVANQSAAIVLSLKKVRHE